MKEKLFKMAILVLLLAAALLAFSRLGMTDPVPWLVIAAALLSALQLRVARGRCHEFLVWGEAYSVGIDEMDQEHRKLLNLINNLRSCILCNTGQEFEQHNLQLLIDYTKTHLQHEEALLQEHAFPDFEGHKAQHDQMISYIESFVRKYQQQGRKILPEIVDYLTLWLTQHIQVTDKKYTDYLLQRGVKPSPG